MNPVQLHVSVSVASAGIVVQSADRISSDYIGSGNWAAAESKLEVPRCFKVVSRASRKYQEKRLLAHKTRS